MAFNPLARRSVSVEHPNGSSYHITLADAKTHVEKQQAVWIEDYKRLAFVPPELKIRGLSCRVGAYIAMNLRKLETQVMLSDICRVRA